MKGRFRVGTKVRIMVTIILVISLVYPPEINTNLCDPTKNPFIASPSAGPESSVQRPQLTQSDLVEHSPIVIQSNAEFEAAGFPGNGTRANPYRIEGMAINDSSVCILINNTNLHFMIQNCLLSSPVVAVEGIGIHLVNTTLGSIFSVYLAGLGHGIRIDECYNVNITSCTAEFGYSSGYFLTGSEDIRLDNASSSWGEAGLHIFACNDLFVNRSYFSGTTAGLLLSNLDSFLITNSEFYCGGYETAAVLYTCSNGEFQSCSVLDSRGTALQLRWCDNIRVSECEFSESARNGILISSSSDITIVSSELTWNSWNGISISQSVRCHLSQNMMHDNQMSGVKVLDSERIEVVDNQISGNVEYGILLEGSNRLCKIYRNQLQNNVDNAFDESENQWDDGRSIGNYWDTYNGSGTYPIPGGRSEDRYPANFIRPIIIPLQDLRISQGNPDALLEWITHDNDPAYYSIFIDSELVKNETWDGSSIDFSLANLSIGNYLIQLTVYDTLRQAAHDTVEVEVVEGIPLVDSFLSFIYSPAIVSVSLVIIGAEVVALLWIRKKRVTYPQGTQ